MNKTYLLLGSNIGKRELFLSQALEEIEKSAGKIIDRSSLYNTAAWPARTTDKTGGGKTDQNDFLNQAICIETGLSSQELLADLLNIEKKMGRTRDQKWEARTIDIDILFFNDDIIETAHLTIPHPYLHKRKFALIPLSEIAPNLIHPGMKKSIHKLLSECEENLSVVRLKID